MKKELILKSVRYLNIKRLYSIAAMPYAYRPPFLNNQGKTWLT